MFVKYITMTSSDMILHQVFEWEEDVDEKIQWATFRGIADAKTKTVKQCGWMSRPSEKLYTSDPSGNDPSGNDPSVNDPSVYLDKPWTSLTIPQPGIQATFSTDPCFAGAHALTARRASWLNHWLGSDPHGQRLHFLRQAWKQPGFHPFATIEQCFKRLSRLHPLKEATLDLVYIIRLSSTQPGAFAISFLVHKKGKYVIQHKRYFIIGSYIMDLSDNNGISDIGESDTGGFSSRKISLGYKLLSSRCEVLREADLLPWPRFTSFHILEEHIRNFINQANPKMEFRIEQYVTAPGNVNGMLID